MEKEKIQEIIEEYQCSGCVAGPYEECFNPVYSDLGIGCRKHCPGTILSGIGKIFLGLPKGFNRIGAFNEKLIPYIFKKLSDCWEYDKFNVPVWKYKNKCGHVFVRVFQPRINSSNIHIFLEDCMKKIKCLEITEKDMEEMD